MLVNGSGDNRDSYYLKRALNPVSRQLMVPEKPVERIPVHRNVTKCSDFCLQSSCIGCNVLRVIRTYVELAYWCCFRAAGQGIWMVLGNLGVFEGLKVKYQAGVAHEIIIAVQRSPGRRLEAAIHTMAFRAQETIKLELRNEPEPQSSSRDGERS